MVGRIATFPVATGWREGGDIRQKRRLVETKIELVGSDDG
jgi:hypothetical protein